MRKEENLNVETPIIDGLEHLKVNDLIDIPNAKWNLRLLNQILDMRDVQAVLLVPMMDITSHDAMV